MKYAVDLSLFQRGAHNPSFFSLARSLREPKNDLIDFCVPCNQYFPTREMFADYEASLVKILKYYPSDSDEIARRLAETFELDPASLVLGNGSTELISWIDVLW